MKCNTHRDNFLETETMYISSKVINLIPNKEKSPMALQCLEVINIHVQTLSKVL